MLYCTSQESVNTGPKQGAINFGGIMVSSVKKEDGMCLKPLLQQFFLSAARQMFYVCGIPFAIQI